MELRDEKTNDGRGANLHDSGGQSHMEMEHGGAAGGARFSVIGVPAETKLLKPTLLAGRGLQPGDTDAIVVNTRRLASSGSRSHRI